MHAKIVYYKNKAKFIDCKSVNGTYVNNTRILNGEEIYLNENDKLKFGKENTIYFFTIEYNTKSEVKTMKFVTDERINLIDENEYKKPMFNHLEKKKELIKKYYYDGLENIDKSEKENIAKLNAALNKISTLEQREINEKKEKEKLIKIVEQYKHTIENTKRSTNEYNSKLLMELSELKDKNNYLVNSLKTVTEENFRLLEESRKSIEFVGTKNSELVDKYNSLLKLFTSISIYSSDITKKCDILTCDYNLLSNELESYRNIDENIVSRDILAKENVLMAKELENIKSYLTSYNLGLNENLKDSKMTLNLNMNLITPKSPNSTTFRFKNEDYNDSNPKIPDLLDKYIIENKNLKKQIENYILREESVNKKWNDLLDENKFLKETNILLRKQLDETKIHFNQIIQKNDINLTQTLNQISKMTKNMEQEAAAKYLVEQMKSILNEKNSLLLEVSRLGEENENIKLLNKKYKNDLSKHLDILLESGDLKNKGKGLDIKYFTNKIDELNDVIIQMKIILDFNKKIEYEDTITILNSEIYKLKNDYKKLIEKIQEYSCQKETLIFDKNEIIMSLSENIQSKDIEINRLINLIKRYEQKLSYNNLDTTVNPRISNNNDINFEDKSNFVSKENYFNSKYIGNQFNNSQINDMQINNRENKNNFSYLDYIKHEDYKFLPSLPVSKITNELNNNDFTPDQNEYKNKLIENLNYTPIYTLQQQTEESNENNAFKNKFNEFSSLNKNENSYDILKKNFKLNVNQKNDYIVNNNENKQNKLEKNNNLQINKLIELEKDNIENKENKKIKDETSVKKIVNKNTEQSNTINSKVKNKSENDHNKSKVNSKQEKNNDLNKEMEKKSANLNNIGKYSINDSKNKGKLLKNEVNETEENNESISYSTSMFKKNLVKNPENKFNENDNENEGVYLDLSHNKSKHSKTKTVKYSNIEKDNNLLDRNSNNTEMNFEESLKNKDKTEILENEKIQSDDENSIKNKGNNQDENINVSKRNNENLSMNSKNQSKIIEENEDSLQNMENFEVDYKNNEKLVENNYDEFDKDENINKDNNIDNNYDY